MTKSVKKGVTAPVDSSDVLVLGKLSSPESADGFSEMKDTTDVPTDCSGNQARDLRLGI